ncbi:uncharacterized protein B0T15DRAFT_544082 [Chaetomium strumarium]|uniref:Uncharacterized protein n=1 Tax=Chaetomium strumarium TaxID=1170767 RepID=A0AAJ0GKJ2_9PEZI|nr:hypothetical protein B0T15DRAFT_544082 [Chaetomium strumarium]
MAEVDDRDVVPDAVLLGHIFGNNQPSSASVILQNWDKCVFKASFSTPLKNGQHECVVRLEVQGATSAFPFAVVPAMQEIARIRIPDLVPETLQVGSAANKEGRAFQYSVVEFVEGVTLEEAWDSMVDEDRKSVTASVVEAFIVPRSPSQMALLRAMEIIVESRQRNLYEGKNIPAHIRRRFIELLQLSRDEDPYVGWRCEGTSLLDFRVDFQKPEDEVIEDMIRRRRMKAKTS